MAFREVSAGSGEAASFAHEYLTSCLCGVMIVCVRSFRLRGDLRSAELDALVRALVFEETSNSTVNSVHLGLSSCFAAVVI